MYSIQALWTAAQRKLPLTVVVANNSGYGTMRSFSQVMDARNVPGLELDLVQIAAGMGCSALRVKRASDLEDALTAGFRNPGCNVVDVAIDLNVPLLYERKP